MRSGLILAAVLALLSAEARAQQQPCAQTTAPKIVSASSYTVSTADRCGLIILTAGGAVAVSLPAPGLIFSPQFITTLLPLNGAALTLSGLPDDAGRVHLVNQSASFPLGAGQGGVLTVQQDFNWYAVPTGQASGVLVSYAYARPSTGDTLTASAGLGAYIIDPAGSIAALSVILPPSPLDRQVFEVSTTRDIIAFGVTATGGASVSGGTVGTLAANGGASWRYRAANATWYRRS